MIHDILFIITLPITLLFIMFWLSLFGKNSISLPPLIGLKATSPLRWYIMYPSLFYQVWYWSTYFELI